MSNLPDHDPAFRERSEWGPQPGGLYRSPIPPKVTMVMADTPRRPADLPGTVVASPSHAQPKAHRWLALRSHPDAPSAAEVADVLNAIAARYVLVGGHAVGCWSASARTTADVDCIVFVQDFRRAQEALAARFPALLLEEHDAVARFSLRTNDGAAEAVDLIRSYDALFLSALENTVTVQSGSTPIRIPCPEVQIALKVAAIRSPNRHSGDVLQDAADLIRICDGRSLREDLLEALTHAVAGPQVMPHLLRDVVHSAQTGGDVIAACKGRA